MDYIRKGVFRMKTQPHIVRDFDWNILIPSKDVRGLIKKEGHTFSDFEIATLIFNGIQTYDEKRACLKTLADSTIDMELKAMIDRRLAIEDEDIAFFLEEKEGFVYLLNSKEFEPEDCYCGCFVNAKLALEYGGKLGFDFSIEKHMVIGNNQTEFPKHRAFTNPYLQSTKDLSECVQEWEAANGIVAKFSYNKEGNLLYFHTELERDLKEELEMLFSPVRFENAYMEIPNPFEKGDVVCVVGTDRWGIVRTSQAEWEEYKMRINQMTGKDFIDASITVDFLYEDGEFLHDHVNPIFLEKMDPDQAVLLAVKYHKGQKDKQGEDYILHPLRVMMRMTDSLDKRIAVLHDVLEDTECTEELLREEGIEEEVIEAIKVLSRKEGEEYFSYIERISKDGRCRRIKQMDLEDNLREGCPETLKKRYRKALERLKYED